MNEDINIVKAEDILSIKTQDIQLITLRIDGVPVDIEVKKNISLSEMIYITDFITEELFKGGYKPEFREVLLFKCILECMTNIEVPSKKIAVDGKEIDIVDLEKCYELMAKTNLIDILFRLYDDIYDVINEINIVLDSKIAHRNNLIYNYRDVDAIVNIISEKFNGINELTEGLNVLVEKIIQISDVAADKLSMIDVSKFSNFNDMLSSVEAEK